MKTFASKMFGMYLKKIIRFSLLYSKIFHEGKENYLCILFKIVIFEYGKCILFVKHINAYFLVIHTY